MEGNGFKWIGNLATIPVGMPAVDHSGIKSTNANLARAANGLWRPAADSPARGAAEGRYASITTDMDGQPRLARHDVGADQL